MFYVSLIEFVGLGDIINVVWWICHWESMGAVNVSKEVNVCETSISIRPFEHYDRMT